MICVILYYTTDHPVKSSLLTPVTMTYVTCCPECSVPCPSLVTQTCLNHDHVISPGSYNLIVINIQHFYKVSAATRDLLQPENGCPVAPRFKINRTDLGDKWKQIGLMECLKTELVMYSRHIYSDIISTQWRYKHEQWTRYTWNTSPISETQQQCFSTSLQDFPEWIHLFLTQQIFYVSFCYIATISSHYLLFLPVSLVYLASNRTLPLPDCGVLSCIIYLWIPYGVLCFSLCVDVSLGHLQMLISGWGWTHLKELSDNCQLSHILTSIPVPLWRR